jgi:ankyrin repeat protein
VYVTWRQDKKSRILCCTRTPLSLAAGNVHEAVVKLLLEKNADIETKDKYRRMPLSLAAGNGHKAVVKLLLGKGAHKSHDLYTQRGAKFWSFQFTK